ncbi:ferritin family protein [Geomonas sp. Red69]|uniref:Ferritin family protein n=1 Tax=Geomonas diazotrophica TaxID=2843197 RepID=A0ABX8JDC3_9BACT|nr:MULTISPECIES: ferritin family protein [Geomonas]MBU5638921.1 ferritin family protein [Geomonas diazotrophica]QWV96400.1 ferritin family protein [Geomonas nitrogeniifigens]QXE85467.1 ferritin family protein [Geomonas nitrogeniifigens]
MNIFDCAIKIEEETKAYYQGLEAEAMEPEMKILFSMLAASEEEHQRKLRRLRKKMDGAMLDGLTSNVCRFRPLLSQKELLEETGRDPNLYRFAVGNEEQEIRFYEELASAATNEKTRKGLRMLAQEERRHLQKVTNIYSFVETPKTFLAWSEFSNMREL